MVGISEAWWYFGQMLQIIYVQIGHWRIYPLAFMVGVAGLLGMWYVWTRITQRLWREMKRQWARR